MKENIIKLLQEPVNGKPRNAVIAQYVERNDVGGLAEFFRAFIIDLYDAIGPIEPLGDSEHGTLTPLKD